MIGRVRSLGLGLALSCSLLCAPLGAGCVGSSRVMFQQAEPRSPMVFIDCDVKDAEVWIDDRFVAHVENLARGIKMKPGAHRVEVRHDGHHTYYEAFRLSEHESHTIRVTMAEILP